MSSGLKVSGKLGYKAFKLFICYLGGEIHAAGTDISCAECVNITGNGGHADRAHSSGIFLVAVNKILERGAERNGELVLGERTGHFEYLCSSVVEGKDSSVHRRSLQVFGLDAEKCVEKYSLDTSHGVTLYLDGVEQLLECA